MRAMSEKWAWHMHARNRETENTGGVSTRTLRVHSAANRLKGASKHLAIGKGKRGTREVSENKKQ